MSKFTMFSGVVLLAMTAVPASLVAAETAPAVLECNDLDFLIGDWKVTMPGGVVVGLVKWEAGPSHCYLKEIWTGRNGSPDYLAVMGYSATARNWGYFGVSPNGVRERYDYGLWQGNELRFEQSEPGPISTRFSFFKRPDGTIRELSVSTNDGGHTWTTNFDVVWNHTENTK